MAGLLVLALPTLPHVQFAVAAGPTTGCMIPPGYWVPLGPPKVVQLGTYQAIEVNYSNYGSAYPMGIVMMVIHNSQGQTVQWTTCTLQIPDGETRTAYTVSIGLEPGTYSATMFVVYTSGIAISPTVTVTFSA